MVHWQFNAHIVAIIYMSNKVEYLDKEESYKNSAKEVILIEFRCFVQELWTNFNVIGTLRFENVVENCDFVLNGVLGTEKTKHKS